MLKIPSVPESGAASFQKTVMPSSSRQSITFRQQPRSKNPTSRNMKCCLVIIMFYFQHIHNLACDTGAPSPRSHLSSYAVLTQSTLLALVSNTTVHELYTHPGSCYWRPGHVVLPTPDTSYAHPRAANDSTRITLLKPIHGSQRSLLAGWKNQTLPIAAQLYHGWRNDYELGH
jgi:hypothetical protein